MCSSAGCTQYLFPKSDHEIKRDYFVPDFGVDQDILDAQYNEKNAQKFLDKRRKPRTQEAAGEETKNESLKDQDEKLKKEADENIKKAAGESSAKEEAKSDAKTEAKEEKKTEEKKEEKKEEAKAEAKAETKAEAKLGSKPPVLGSKPPAATAIMLSKNSDPICSSDPTDKCWGKKEENKEVVYPIYPTQKDIAEGKHQQDVI